MHRGSIITLKPEYAIAKSFCLDAGQLACSVSLEGSPVQVVVAKIRSKSGPSFRECRVHTQGDQLFVKVPGHAEMQVLLPFGVDGSLSRGIVADDGINLRLAYAPIQSLWIRD